MFKIRGKRKKKPIVRNVPLATSVPEGIFGMFEMIAQDNGLNKSELLRQVVIQFLKEYKGQ